MSKQPPSQPFQHKQPGPAVNNIFTNKTINTNNIFSQNNKPPTKISTDERGIAAQIFNVNPDDVRQKLNSGEKDPILRQSEEMRAVASNFIKNLSTNDDASISQKTEKKEGASEVKESSKLAKKSTKSPQKETRDNIPTVLEDQPSFGAKNASVGYNFMSFGANNPAFTNNQSASQQNGTNLNTSDKKTEGNTQTHQQQKLPTIDPNSNTLVQGGQPNTSGQSKSNIFQKDPPKATNTQQPHNAPSSTQPNQATNQPQQPQSVNPFNQNTSTNIFNTQQTHNQNANANFASHPNQPVNSGQDPNFVPAMTHQDYIIKQKILYPNTGLPTQDEYLEYFKESFDPQTLTVGEFLTAVKSSLTNISNGIEHLWTIPESLLRTFQQNKLIQSYLDELTEDIDDHPSQILNTLIKMEQTQSDIDRHLTKMEEKMKNEKQVHNLAGELTEMEEIEEAMLDYQLDFSHENQTQLQEIFASLMATERELNSLTSKMTPKS